MIKKILFIFIYICIVEGVSLRAQDIHFSQFFTTPLLVNPANTGFFNCDYRFTTNYRSQWNSVTVPYNTFTASGDLRLVKAHNSKDIFGLGVVASVDEAGDSRFTSTQFGLAGAFHKNLDRYGTQYLGMGLMLGYTSSTIDYSSLIFYDQYRGAAPLGQTTEDISKNSLGFLDVSAGVSYDLVPNHNNSFTVGGAVYHINAPNQFFIKDDGSNLPRKYVLSSGADFKVSNHLELLPKAMFELQGASNELVFGSLMRLNLDKSKDDKYAIYLGALYRWNDAVVIVTRFDISNFSFSFSYDLNVSGLTLVSESKGGPELSLIYIGCIASKPHKNIYCPRF